MSEYVILVDEQNNPLGLMEKQEAHEKALLHRAFSIFIFNSEGKLLLQQRAHNKYHSAGLWTNTCCSHPRQNESTIEAANRRLIEEMGLHCTLKEQFHFIYQVNLDNGLHEHELDFVYTGETDENPTINPLEVADYRWITMADLYEEVTTRPEQFTYWFRIILNEYMNRMSPY